MIGGRLPVDDGCANGTVDVGLGKEFRSVAGRIGQAVKNGDDAGCRGFEDYREGAEIEASVEHFEVPFCGSLRADSLASDASVTVSEDFVNEEECNSL